MMSRTALLSLVICLGAAGLSAAQTTLPALDLDGAARLAALAAAQAKSRNAAGSIAVVDAGGHLLFLERLDRTFPAAATVSVEKARTAATFNKPTRDFEDAIKNGRLALLGVDVMTPLQGGVPLEVDGHVVGAIGVSGTHTAQEDDAIAQAAVKAFGMAPTITPYTSNAVYLPRDRVMAAFEKGMPLVETSGYKVHASRREGPGMAEVHTRDTDIIYVLQGSVTIVTGGTVVEPKSVGTDEIRGRRIAGGNAMALNQGDVLIVPAGMPHWFSQVDEAFLYYVVKTTGADMAGTK